VVRGANLFPEEIQASRHGPVVREVSSVLARGPVTAVIGKKELATATPLREEEAVFVKAVWEAYQQYSASRLADMARSEAPWREAWGDRAADASGFVHVPDLALAEYFDRQMVPASIAAHREYREARDRAAREELAAMPPLDLEKFAAAARSKGGTRPKKRPAVGGSKQ
jgi:hypothetical protein